MSEWQPIETAPDENVVIGGWWTDPGEKLISWHETVTTPWMDTKRFGVTKRFNAYDGSSWTHWCPLPEPPHKETEK